MAMSKEQLADKITAAIKDLVATFVAQPSPELAEAQERFNDLERQKSAAIQTFGEGSAVAHAAIAEIERQQKRLTIDDAKSEKLNRHHAAFAVVHSCNVLRLPVTLKKDKQPAAPTNGTPMLRRPSATDMERWVSAVKGVLGKEWMSKDEIAASAELDRPASDSALAKLKRDGYAVTNGLRGSGGKWRKA